MLSKARIIQILGHHLKDTKLLDLTVDGRNMAPGLFNAFIETYNLGFDDGHKHNIEGEEDNWRLQERLK